MHLKNARLYSVQAGQSVDRHLSPLPQAMNATQCLKLQLLLHAAMMITWFACVRFRPTAPERMDNKKMVVGGSSRKSYKAFLRCVIVMSDVSVRN
mmetsp:Transcript_801/g.1052  ORF Transcript_801/g.1052 Transcript_801/m.1052 type:complete len:95 (-) Transcript_801:2529-2813(-)